MTWIMQAAEADWDSARPGERFRWSRWWSEVVRPQVLDQAAGHCEDCGLDLTGTKWNAHHINPIGTEDEGLFSHRVENLAALCISCHMKRHSATFYQQRWQRTRALDSGL